MVLPGAVEFLEPVFLLSEAAQPKSNEGPSTVLAAPGVERTAYGGEKREAAMGATALCIAGGRRCCDGWWAV